MRKAFIAGGKFADIPTIKAAKNLGFYTITSGNNPQDLGHTISDEVALEDYSDKEAMKKLVERLKPDILIPACDDYSILTCAYVNDFLQISNFDSFRVTETIHHKDLWRRFCVKHHIDSPKAFDANNINDAIDILQSNFLHQKIIIKPVDSASGKGVGIIHIKDIKNTYDENVQTALKLAFANSRKKTIVLEEFIDGSRHGFSTILINQKVAFYFYDDEQYAYNPFAVSGTTTSSKITIEMQEELIKTIQKIAKILNLSDGIFHTQTIAKLLPNGKKRLVIIEACRRAGGDLYPQFVQMATKIDYPSMIIKSIGGLEIPKISHHISKQFIARQCVMSKHCGILENINISDEIRHNIVDKLMWHKKGEKILDTKKYKAGIVFLKFDSELEMQEKIANLGDLIKINVK